MKIRTRILLLTAALLLFSHILIAQHSWVKYMVYTPTELQEGYGNFELSRLLTSKMYPDWGFRFDYNSLQINVGEKIHVFRFRGRAKFCMTGNGNLYIAGRNEFGRITNEDGKPGFESLLDSSFITTYSFGQVNNIFEKKGIIYFYTQDQIFSFMDDEVSLVHRFPNPVMVYERNGQIFVFETSGNIYYLRGNQLVPFVISGLTASAQFSNLMKLVLSKVWVQIGIFISLALVMMLFIVKRLLRRIKETSESSNFYHGQVDELKRLNDDLAKVSRRNEDLLANILPKQTAMELQNNGRANVHKYSMCTVLFADIQGFTKIAERLKPEILVDYLDKIFVHFDSVIDKYNIEKIKTIGDAYMCAGGIPKKNRTNPIEVLLAGLEMQHHLRTLPHPEAPSNMSSGWSLRVGIHTGTVVAGVVGKKKFTYDIWGDSVNVASRMETAGDIGKVNISSSTYNLVKDYFKCEYRGKMPVKYKGEIEMYFVTGIKPEYSQENNPIKPNQKLLTKIDFLKYLDLQDEIMERLQNSLPKMLYYHNITHTKKIILRAEKLGKAEKINEEDMLLLKTAALLHDSGFMIGHTNHEILSADFAREVLRDFQYSQSQIDTICETIIATKPPVAPANLIQGILCDADLEYFGSRKFLEVADKMYREKFETQVNVNYECWAEGMLKLLSQHEFYTETARALREVSKEEQIALFKASLKQHR